MALPISVAATETTFANGEFTVTAGTTTYLLITGGSDGGVPSGVDFEVAFKTTGGAYTVYWVLNANNIREFSGINAPGTWAARRLLSTRGSAGLEKKE